MSDRIRSEIVHAVVRPTQYWHLGADGKSRKASLSGRLAGTRLMRLVFELDGRPLETWPSWSKIPRIIAPVIAQALINMARRDRLVLSPYSGPDHLRRIGRRRVYMHAQQAAYFDAVLEDPTINFAWLTYRVQEYQHGPILVEAEPPLATNLVQKFWDAWSFRGYILPRDDEPDLLALLKSSQVENWRLRKDRELSQALVYFEDWDEGCGVRFWSRQLSHEQIEGRLNPRSLETAMRKLRHELRGLSLLKE